jgi:polyisoprenoid-binding protein YceI
LLAFCDFALPAAGQNRVFTADPGQSRVEFTLGDVLHTVHGTFRLQSGDLHFNSSTGAAEGQLVVDAGSGDSGNRARDNKMKRDILETQKYPEIVFTPQQVKGTIAAQGKSEVELDGIMNLHGQPHAMAIAVPLTMNGNSASADISFDVPYVKWGLKNPSTLFLRVNDRVQIKIHVVGSLQPQ